jgi:hypothetical protein
MHGICFGYHFPTAWSVFGLTGLGEAEVICLRNKAW